MILIYIQNQVIDLTFKAGSYELLNEEFCY
jgi:hypothetical protein